MKHCPVKRWKITTPLTNPHFTNGETEAQKVPGSANMFAAPSGPSFKAKEKVEALSFFPTCLLDAKRGSQFSPPRLKECQESREQGKAGKCAPQSTSPSQRNPAWDLAKPKLLFAIWAEIN